jgi:uncharacterized protein YndB with AHSA1/START domain
MSTDNIEKKILLRAPLSRVWQAISDSKEFGSWFGMKINGPFVAGAIVGGTIAQTTVDAEVAALQKPYEGTAVTLLIASVEPERLFSFRWRPYAVEAGTDYSAEPTTLVEFALSEEEGGVMLTLTESGFDQIPLERRAQAFSANEGGWAMQMKLIEKYLALKPAL